MNQLSLKQRIAAIPIVDPHDSTVGAVLGNDRMETLMKIIEEAITENKVMDHSKCPMPMTCVGYENAMEDVMYAIGAKR